MARGRPLVDGGARLAPLLRRRPRGGTARGRLPRRGSLLLVFAERLVAADPVGEPGVRRMKVEHAGAGGPRVAEAVASARRSQDERAGACKHDFVLDGELDL